MEYMTLIHIIIMFATFYREIFTAKTNLFGQIMRIIEIFCIPLYLYGILKSLEYIELMLIRTNSLSPLAVLSVKEFNLKNSTGEIEVDITKSFLVNKCSRADAQIITGRTFEWLIIEVAVFTFLIFTMLITMAKSRCMKVGIDNS